MLPQLHTKDLGHSVKSADGRSHVNTHNPLSQGSRSGLTILFEHSVRTYQGNELTRNSSGNTRPQSSQLAGPLWTDPCLKSGISVRVLISTLKKKAQAQNEWSNILPKSLQVRKKPPPIVTPSHCTIRPRTCLLIPSEYVHI